MQSSAAPPVEAVSTAYPAPCKPRERKSAIRFSSSTTRIRINSQLSAGERLLPQQLQVARHGLDPAEEIRQVEFFVGGMQVVVRQAESHHDAGNAQALIEYAHDGNGTARADVD